MKNEPLLQWMTSTQQAVELALEHYLPGEHRQPQTLHAAMRYSTLQGGKRIRPLLAYAAGELTGADEADLARAACGVEMIHAYSLVHDDMPCMDDDVLRRGKPTCHIAFDEATALLVGDSLQTLAFELLASPDSKLPPATQLTMVRLLAQASGHAGMAGGQAIDLSSVGKQLNQTELEFMHCLKTGALIRAAVLLGAHCGQPLSADELDALDHFAKRIGLAFQVVDDVLDVEADSQTLGKTAGKDEANDKPTYVSLMGLSSAKQYARDLYEDAISALSPFGSKAERLRQLAEYIVARSF